LFLLSKPNGEAVSRGGGFTESFGEMTIKVQIIINYLIIIMDDLSSVSNSLWVDQGSKHRTRKIWNLRTVPHQHQKKLWNYRIARSAPHQNQNFNFKDSLPVMKFRSKTMFSKIIRKCAMGAYGYIFSSWFSRRASEDST